MNNRILVVEDQEDNRRIWREVTAVFTDLRGFMTFSDAAARSLPDGYHPARLPRQRAESPLGAGDEASRHERAL